ncbi:hypothetical protein THSYN_28420 [Candidatus Thiodictyon syntrophicum]|uniref:Peptidoglycan binding-like domain-containing protein n=1 Tax=Candidatus Thiodictyon syntrophicum TaxID=1166950 RepID=A0A2K8UFV4_9GAMM|nr:hypothetical protein THSYN_28420 [Candidatus Thiodictyon syntrophicum]
MSKSFLVHYIDGKCRDTIFEDVSAGGGGLSISASVGVSGVNRPEDVTTIQKAVNQVPTTSGGPLTPLVLDGICGSKTKKAIQDFQLKHFGWKGADGRVDPGQQTILKLQEFQSGGGVLEAPGQGGQGRLSANPGGSDLDSNPYVLMLMHDRVAEAYNWVLSAKRTLNAAQDLLAGNLTITSDWSQPQLDLVKKYFHLKDEPRAHARDIIRRIYRIFSTMEMAIGHRSAIGGMSFGGGGCLWPDPTVNNVAGGKLFAYTFYGGWSRRNERTGLPRMSKEDNYQGPNLREDTIFIATNNFGGRSQEMYATTLVHELAHFVGPDLYSLTINHISHPRRRAGPPSPARSRPRAGVRSRGFAGRGNRRTCG